MNQMLISSIDIVHYPEKYTERNDSNKGNLYVIYYYPKELP